MAKTVRCECGAECPVEDGTLSPLWRNCPACGQPLPTDGFPPPLLTGDDAAPPAPRPPAPPPAPPPVPQPAIPTATAESDASVPLFLRLLLDPVTIRRLLIFGGTVSILGLIAWLVSVGVFDDPRVLAASLGAGNLALLGAGWATTLQTRHKLAGQALTFLGCVLAPLNLWFYDAQNLLTVEGHLWVGAFVCSLLYVATVRVLRDPLFLYAVEAGITLTALLLLGDLGRATDSVAVCSALVGLAAVSIHAHAAFSKTDPEFNRTRYGLPLFFAGQAQLAVATLTLLGLQTVQWSAPEMWPGLFPYSRIATTPWLAGVLWLATSYLWLYSDLVVRKLGVYSYLAAIALMLVEATWLHDVLPVEALMMGLSLTALAIRVGMSRVWMTGTEPAEGDLVARQARARWLGLAGEVGLVVAAVPCVIGLARHFEVPFSVWTEQRTSAGLFALAWLVLAVSTGGQGWLQRRDRIGTEQARDGLFGLHAWLAGVSLWLAVHYGVLATGNDELNIRLTAASLVPVLGAYIAIRVPRAAGRPLASAMLATGLAGTLLSLLTEQGFEVARLLLEPRDALFASVILATWGLVWLAMGTVGRWRLAWRIVGGFWLGMSLLKLLQWVDLAEEAYGPVLAGLGVTLIALGPYFRRTSNGTSGTVASPASSESAWNPVVSAGDLSLLLGELIVFLRLAAAVFRPGFEPLTGDILPALVTAFLAAVGACLAPTGPVRGWHGFATGCLVFLSGAWGLRALELSDFQKVEVAIEAIGLALIGAGYSGRLQEKAGQREPGVSLVLWLGSFGAILPVLLITLAYRLFDRDVSFGDELALVTIGLLMVASGCVMQVRSTSILGALGLATYLVVLFAELVHRPQVALGAYLAIGGGVVFLIGVALSVYRDRILALPSKIAHREGIFQVIDWR